MYCNDLEDLTGQFTALSDCVIYGLLDEVAFSGGYKTNSKLKSILTQQFQKMERKGKDATMVDNYANYCFLSNNEDAVKIEDTDRRYFVKRTSSARVGDFEYFENLKNILRLPLFPTLVKGFNAQVV